MKIKTTLSTSFRPPVNPSEVQTRYCYGEFTVFTVDTLLFTIGQGIILGSWTRLRIRMKSWIRNRIKVKM
jgi:hypothetical protein